MVETILPEPVEVVQPIENSITIEKTPRRRSNSTITVLIIVVLIAFLGLVGGVIYDYANNHSQDNTRKQDLAYIASLAETFHDLNHYYPSLSQINSTSFGALNPQGLKKADFKDPTSKSYLLTSSPTPNGYAYITNPSDCNNLTVNCLHFKLVAVTSNNQDYTVVSRH